jgi:CHAT domain-containing protein
VREAVRSVGGGCEERTGLERLEGSRREADAIARLVPEGQRLEAVDFAANLELATGGELGRYQVVHFATHGYVPADAPELAGLVLSLVDAQGREREGYLGLPQIYNLRLPAEVVVLSACETGLGKQVRGEGLVGLVRGFMYAGARRVVASLWKVDDRETSALMAAFYREMLVGKQAPSAALRAAQLRMVRQDRAPYVWAAFQLSGEWR